MDRKQIRINLSKGSKLLRLLRSVKCSNFRVVGVGIESFKRRRRG